MSIVSSVFSSRSTPWGPIHARAASLMDSIFAIAFGLGLRFVVDVVSHHDFKLSGTIVGLWEGVVMLHFVKKMPKSYDPYIALGVRLFVDFLVTESVARLVLVLVWTGLGMVLADIAPAIWVDVGLHRIWRRFRRDMYTISSKIPRVALFPRTRTVRFSSSRAPSVVTSLSSSITPPSTAAPPLTTRVIPPTPSPAKPARKRPVPGSFPGAFSETETDIGSILGLRPQAFSEASTSALGTTHHRYSATPRRHRRYSDETPTELSSTLSRNDLDDGNRSDSSSSTSASTVDPSAFNPSEIPDVEEEVAPTPVDKGKKPMRGGDDEERDVTPRPNPIKLPPTPSDSARAFDFNIDVEEPPPTSKMPLIPDVFDSSGFSDWENVTKEDAAPIPPPKDDIYTNFPRTPSPAPQPVPPPIDPLPVLHPEPPAPAAEAVFDSLDEFEMNFDTTAPLFPEPQHHVDVDISARPSMNDLMGLGTDRPPSYTDPYGQGYGASESPEKAPGGVAGDVIPEETDSALVSPVVNLDNNEGTEAANYDAMNNERSDDVNANDDLDANAKAEEEADKKAEDDASKTEVGGSNDAVVAATGTTNDDPPPPPPHDLATDPLPDTEEPSTTAAHAPATDPLPDTEEPPTTAAHADPDADPAESIASSISEFLSSVTDRLHQALILRGQILQTEKIVQDLLVEKEVAGEGWSKEQEAQLKKAEKALGKMERKVERRYKAACEEHDTTTPPADVNIEAVPPNPDKISEKIEEALELHLQPGKKSFKFAITVGKQKVGKAQKPLMVDTLDGYRLTAVQDAKNGRIQMVEITEEEYPDWLEAYRISMVEDNS